jgi:hypothetical protein
MLTTMAAIWLLLTNLLAMAVGLAAAVANGWLNAMARAVNYTAPVAFFIQLHTADPGAAGTTAIAGNGVRKAVTFGTAAAGGAISNTAIVSWASGDVDTSEDYTHWSAWDAVTAGNFLGSGLMTANAVVIGDQFQIPIGDIDLTLNIAA